MESSEAPLSSYWIESEDVKDHLLIGVLVHRGYPVGGYSMYPKRAVAANTLCLNIDGHAVFGHELRTRYGQLFPTIEVAKAAVEACCQVKGAESC